MPESLTNTASDLIDKFHAKAIESKVLAEQSTSKMNEIFEGLTSAFMKRERELLEIISERDKEIEEQVDIIIKQKDEIKLGDKMYRKLNDRIHGGYE